jgi:hypothetical protein
MAKYDIQPGKSTFTLGTKGRIRRDQRRQAINGKRAFAFMGSVGER